MISNKTLKLSQSPESTNSQRPASAARTASQTPFQHRFKRPACVVVTAVPAYAPLGSGYGRADLSPSTARSAALIARVGSERPVCYGPGRSAADAAERPRAKDFAGLDGFQRSKSAWPQSEAALEEKAVMKLIAAFALAAIAGGIVTAPALAQDADAGKKVFAKCRACHDAEAEKNKVGPHLVGVIGRTAGGLDSFQSKYSKAMKEAGAGGLVWDEEKIEEYLENPKEFIPGNKMAFPGLKKDEEIDNVIAYLKADPKP
jgi:cytochrome c